MMRSDFHAAFRRACLVPAREVSRVLTHAVARAIARVSTVAILGAACSSRTSDGTISSAQSDSATARATIGATPRATDSAAPASADGTLIGKLVGDVVPDSAYLSAWGVYPLERHIGIVLARVGGAHYLLADTLVGYDGPRARWLIRQAQRVEAAGKGEAWVASCAIGKADASDGTVVARVTLGDGDTLAPIHAAWRLDPATWRFRPFPTDSLTCYNEGMGA